MEATQLDFGVLYHQLLSSLKAILPPMPKTIKRSTASGDVEGSRLADHPPPKMSHPLLMDHQRGFASAPHHNEVSK